MRWIGGSVLFKNIKEAIKTYYSQEGNLFRSSLGYGFLLTLFPALIIIVIFFQNGVLDIQTTSAFIYRYLPQELIQPFIEYVMASDFRSISTVVVTMAAVTILASKSFYSFLLISATHENFITYGLVIRIKAIILFIGFFGGIFLLASSTHFFNEFPFLALVGGIFLILYMLYRALSFRKRNWFYGIIGAVFSTVGILLVGGVFLSVIERFTDYSTIYGPLSGLLILLLSVHLIASIIYFGYCLNITFASDNENKIKTECIYRYINNIVNNVKRITSRK